MAAPEQTTEEPEQEEHVAQVKSVKSPLNLFRHLFRLLTPEEVADITTISTGDRRVPLTVVLDARDVDQTFDDLIEEMEKEEEAERMAKSRRRQNAKIIPFEPSGDDDVDEMMEQMSEAYLAGKSPQSAEETAVMEENQAAVEEKQVEARSFTKDTPIDRNNFILDVKEKMKKNHRVLKSREVLSLYQKNASVDIEQAKQLKEDLSKSANMGVLVNKRQY